MQNYQSKINIYFKYRRYINSLFVYTHKHTYVLQYSICISRHRGCQRPNKVKFSTFLLIIGLRKSRETIPLKSTSCTVPFKEIRTFVHKYPRVQYAVLQAGWLLVDCCPAPQYMICRLRNRSCTYNIFPQLYTVNLISIKI